MRKPKKVVIPGRPKPYQRVRRGKGDRLYLPPGYREYRDDVAAKALRMLGPKDIGPEDLVEVWITVYSDKVEVWFSTLSGSHRPKGIRGDLDNYGKTILDAAQAAGILPDDRQVVRMLLRFASPEEEGIDRR
jgi:Holliday junction resolvase RusA-like endonuclease